MSKVKALADNPDLVELKRIVKDRHHAAAVLARFWIEETKVEKAVHLLTADDLETPVQWDGEDKDVQVTFEFVDKVKAE